MYYIDFVFNYDLNGRFIHLILSISIRTLIVNWPQWREISSYWDFQNFVLKSFQNSEMWSFSIIFLSYSMKFQHMFKNLKSQILTLNGS